MSLHNWKILREVAGPLWKFRKTNVRVRNSPRSTILGIGGATCISLAALNIKDNETLYIFGGTLRFLRSLRIGITISLDYYFGSLGLNNAEPNYKAMMSRIHQRSADRILEGCLLNGGCYVKLGQGLVALSHILPKEYVDTLMKLQDKCLYRAKDELFQLFKEDFGQPPEEIYKEFNSDPIAAASLAQVYKAKTKDDQEVAVKVQYIDLRRRFKSDVLTLSILLKLIGFMHPDFNFSWVLEDLKGELEQELDFEHEAKNSERCAKDLKHLNYIYVPKVMWEYCSKRVLVTEFIDGFKINDVENLKKHDFSLVDVDLKLFEAFGQQIFHSGFVHADPHPGNVLVRRCKGEAQLVLLDHGLYQSLTSDVKHELSEMWKAIVLNDKPQMVKSAQKLGVQDHETLAEILTQAPLRKLNFKLKAKLSDEDLDAITKAAQHKFDTIMDCLKAMPRSLILVVRNLNTIRAISYDHGSPIDRYSVLARTATKRAFGENRSIVKRITKIPVKVYFEIKLLWNRFSMWLLRIVLNLFSYFYARPDMNAIMMTANF